MNKRTLTMSYSGFNEPNAGNQANMSPQDACNNWKPVADTGLRLGSPAATQLRIKPSMITKWMIYIE